MRSMTRMGIYSGALFISTIFLFQNCGNFNSDQTFSEVSSLNSDFPHSSITLVDEGIILDEIRGRDPLTPTAPVVATAPEQISNENENVTSKLVNLQVVIPSVVSGASIRTGRDNCEEEISRFNRYRERVRAGERYSLYNNLYPDEFCIFSYPHSVLTDIESHISLRKIQAALNMLYTDYLTSNSDASLEIKSGVNKFIDAKKLTKNIMELGRPITGPDTYRGEKETKSPELYDLEKFVVEMGLDYTPETELVTNGGTFKFEIPSGASLPFRKTLSPIRYEQYVTHPAKYTGMIDFSEKKSIIICFHDCKEHRDFSERAEMGRNFYRNLHKEIQRVFLNLESLEDQSIFTKLAKKDQKVFIKLDKEDYKTYLYLAKKNHNAFVDLAKKNGLYPTYPEYEHIYPSLLVLSSADLSATLRVYDYESGIYRKSTHAFNSGQDLYSIIKQKL